MHDILRETPIYQEILREGREEGLEQGQLKQVRSMLLTITQNRFPSLLSEAKSCTENTSNIKVLEDLTLKVAIAQDAEEVSHYLLNWKEIYKNQL